MTGAGVYAFPVQHVLGTQRELVVGPCLTDNEHLLIAALDRLLSATVDADLAHGVMLSEEEAEAREEAVAAIARVRGCHG